jgi:hypothetical protein
MGSAIRNGSESSVSFSAANVSNRISMLCSTDGIWVRGATALPRIRASAVPGFRILQCVTAIAMLASAANATDDELRLLFTGDVLLSRQVQAEIARSGRFPWAGLQGLFRASGFVVGNLEGAVGSAGDCAPAASASPCFAIPRDLISLLSRAGFGAMGAANNHAGDLGEPGREATRAALAEAGIRSLSWEDSPIFVESGRLTIGIVAVSLVADRSGLRSIIPSVEAGQKLRMARGLSDIVVVFVHWGSELLDWPDARQRNAAAWFGRHGADLVVGHHPHVVQPAECVAGRPVFYSLGNHLFDQKYPATKQGLIADCRIKDGSLSCGGVATATPAGSSFPGISEDGGGAEELETCTVALKPRNVASATALAGRAGDGGRYAIEGHRAGERPWRSVAMPIVSAEVGRLAGRDGPEYVVMLERRASSIDGEDGVRPYIYEVGPRGLVARWRGSALAWPLIDAQVLPGGEGWLCALHRSDSFMALDPRSGGTRTAVYRWNGFGFAGVEDEHAMAECRDAYADVREGNRRDP